MLYDVSSPEEYLTQLEDDWRANTLKQVRALILREAPEMEESIVYKMLAYGIGENILFQLNAQRNYVSLYVGDITKIDPEKELMAGFNMGKGCIRLRKTDDPHHSGLQAFIRRGIQLWRDGADTSC